MLCDTWLSARLDNVDFVCLGGIGGSISNFNRPSPADNVWNGFWGRSAQTPGIDVLQSSKNDEFQVGVRPWDQVWRDTPNSSKLGRQDGAPSGRAPSWRQRRGPDAKRRRPSLAHPQSWRTLLTPNLDTPTVLMHPVCHLAAPSHRSKKSCSKSFGLVTALPDRFPTRFLSCTR